MSVSGGVLTITGDANGTTGGMAWRDGHAKYGRWEAHVRAPVADPSYNALALLWPDAEDFPVGGEVDFMEMTDETRRQVEFFLHYGSGNSQDHGSVQIDATQWHTWAVEWTETAIVGYVDGVEWYRNTDTSHFPPRPMHLTLQLDWFPKGGSVQQSTMEVDWVRYTPINDSVLAVGDSAGGTGTIGGTGGTGGTGTTSGTDQDTGTDRATDRDSDRDSDGDTDRDTDRDRDGDTDRDREGDTDRDRDREGDTDVDTDEPDGTDDQTDDQTDGATTLTETVDPASPAGATASATAATADAAPADTTNPTTTDPTTTDPIEAGPTEGVLPGDN
jgi:hypothetical protein